MELLSSLLLHVWGRITVLLAIFLASIFLATTSLDIPSAHANFALGAFSQDNHIEEFLQTEQIQGIRYQVVAFSYDTFTTTDAAHLQKAIERLGQDRVYHISISPFWLSSQEVADGDYDIQYQRFFDIVKKSKAKFVFRTMHEMNGSWYSWSGDPKSFKEAWKHVYSLSRKIWLSSTNILFVMSVNSQDLPSKNNRIGGELVFCNPKYQKISKCLSMEDYYPGDDYVDMMGITLYNWWRGRSESWATWRSFEDLLMDPDTQMYNRLLAYNKPIFIDEVGTTAVDFIGPWSNRKVMEGYQNGAERKNTWLTGMKESIKNHPEIVGVVYFNRDKTYELGDRTAIGELDWAVVSPLNQKVYSAYFDIFSDVQCNIGAVPFVRVFTIQEIELQTQMLLNKVFKKVVLSSKIALKGGK